MAELANVVFLPWVRQGAAAGITTVDTLSADMLGSATLEATVSVNGAAPASVTLQLRGPADVLGIDPNEIVRVDPRPGTSDFEPNYFPCIEFDRVDFPWLFTPASAGANGRLRPWLILVVVRVQEGVSVSTTPDAPLPVLQIAPPARLADELPDLGESWGWVHAQVAAGSGSAADVRAGLAGGPELSLSRLLCPRRLAPETEYVACVVPAFDLGRSAGLGEAIPEGDITSGSALKPAWPPLDPATKSLSLPVYYSWRFRTGVGGDFQSLVELLHVAVPSDRLGRRPIDVSRPGFTLPASFPSPAVLDLEGALQPLERSADPAPWPAGTADPFQSGLANIVNTADPAVDPVLAPPLYGRWHAAKSSVTRQSESWFDVLNLDPRHRVLAALGTRVVQEHQEALMASAWEQAGELQRANQRVRRLQLSVLVNASLHARHFARLDDQAVLRVGAPAFGRIRSGAAGDATATIVAAIEASVMPMQAASPAMRRIGRQRGPLTRRIAAQGESRVASRSWIVAFNASAVLPQPVRLSLATFTAVLRSLPPATPIREFGEVTQTLVADLEGRPDFQIAREGEPVAVSSQLGGVDNAVAQSFRAAAREHLSRIKPERLGRMVGPPPPLKLRGVRDAVLGQLHAARTVAALARATLSVAANATSPTGDAASPAIETIMAAPHFPQPMYEPLRDLDQDLLLPGLAAVGANSVLGLKTNRRFVEAFMVGLNVELGRELLWRGFPTDQRGTYFDRFWDSRSAGVARPDIDALHLWQSRRLGDAQQAPAREQFVLLLRSDLLRRYPTAVIYAVPARLQGTVRLPSLDADAEVYPVFRGSMDPDVAFFGFDLSPSQVVGDGTDLGYYIVIQEQPTEPRFGLDKDTPPSEGTHLGIGSGAPSGLPLNGFEWGRNASHMAGITRQRPVRIAIPGSRFMKRT